MPLSVCLVLLKPEITLVLFVFLVCFCHAALSVPCSLVITCQERADLFVILFVMFS